MNIKEESYLESKVNLSSPSSSQDSSSSLSIRSHYDIANQMLFNQQNYFEGYHQDYSTAAQMPMLSESSLLTFQSGLGQMGHYGYEASGMQPAAAFGHAKLNSPTSSSSDSPGIKAEVEEKKADSEDSSSSASADSASTSSTPFQPVGHHDSTLISAEQAYNYNYQNQYVCNQNRLSVCLKYNSAASDQLNQIAAAAVAAVVSNSSGVPSSSSSSSSISMEEFSDGSPQSNTYAHAQFQHVPRVQTNMAGYSPNNNLVGFYNNLENSASYYSNQQKNLNLSSSSSSSSASYPNRESEYFAYQNYLTNHSEPNELINPATHGYPLQSSPSLIQNQFVGSHLAQFNSLDQQYLHPNFNNHLPVNNNYALTATASRRCSPESNSSHSASYVKNSQYASK